MKFILMLLPYFLTQACFAQTGYLCKNLDFPQGIGSQLSIQIHEQGHPDGEATLEVLDKDLKPTPLNTRGQYQISQQTYNENGNPINYIRWVAGHGYLNKYSNISYKAVLVNTKTLIEKSGYVIVGFIHKTDFGSKTFDIIYQCQ